MLINMYTFYKKKLESLHAGDGVMPLVNLSDIIAHNVISNRNAQQIRPLTVDDKDSSAKMMKIMMKIPTNLYPTLQNTWIRTIGSQCSCVTASTQSTQDDV